MTELHYGETILDGFLPPQVIEEGRLIPLAKPPVHPRITDLNAAIEKILLHPEDPEILPVDGIIKSIGENSLISIILDDHTRPNNHTRLLLPILVDKLVKFGARPENLRYIIATGTHRASKEKELAHIMGEAFFADNRELIVMHSSKENLAEIGMMPDGTPVEMNETAFRSGLLIALTDVEFHYFAGIAGGPKSLVPGIAGEEIIRIEHLKMFGECGFAHGAETGNIDENPVFQYKKQIVSLIRKVMRENGRWLLGIASVIDPGGNCVFLSAGDILASHERALPALRDVYIARVEREADIFIISARHEGINLYQAGKTFNAASKAVKPGGKILVLAQCLDGIGNDDFKNLMKISASIFKGTKKKIDNDIIRRATIETQKVVMEGFKIGYQKPIDLLSILLHTGWGNLYLIQEGLSKEERSLLPITIFDAREKSPSLILSDLIAEWERDKPNYLVVDDPGYLILPSRS